MKYSTLACLIILCASGCAKHVPPQVDLQPKPPAPAIEHPRMGAEAVQSQSGGQVVIQKADEYVLTLDPRPPVIPVPKPKPAVKEPKPAPATDSRPADNKESCQNCQPERVWKDLCDGKILTQEQLAVLDDNPPPDHYAEGKCAPAWQGEK